jgi:hypothetical protein
MGASSPTQIRSLIQGALTELTLAAMGSVGVRVKPIMQQRYLSTSSFA